MPFYLNFQLSTRAIEFYGAEKFLQEIVTQCLIYIDRNKVKALMSKTLPISQIVLSNMKEFSGMPKIFLVM